MNAFAAKMGWLGVVLACLGAAIAADIGMETQMSATEVPPDRPVLPPPIPLLELSLGFRQIVSDFYWLGAIQYAGSSKNGERGVDFQDAWGYGAITTELDPGFLTQYFVYHYALTRARRADLILKANCIMKRGIEGGITDWEPAFFLAFNTYFHLGDFAAAARYMKLASENPTAPGQIRGLASRLAAESGDMNFAREMVRSQMKDMLGNKNLKFTPEKRREIERDFAERLRLIDMQEIINRLDKLVAAFRQREGRAPLNLQELVAKGDLQQIPADPTGGQFELNEEGEVRSTVGNRFILFGKEKLSNLQHQGEKFVCPKPARIRRPVD
ncbi:MAG: hypothetical protein GMKNLPBB_00843 [Myxococcota bacterium]|nr:hypothetical protein [Myxococcota bacterium]